MHAPIGRRDRPNTRFLRHTYFAKARVAVLVGDALQFMTERCEPREPRTGGRRGRIAGAVQCQAEASACALRCRTLDKRSSKKCPGQCQLSARVPRDRGICVLGFCSRGSFIASLFRFRRPIGERRQLFPAAFPWLVVVRPAVRVPALPSVPEHRSAPACRLAREPGSVRGRPLARVPVPALPSARWAEFPGQQPPRAIQGSSPPQRS